MIARLRDRFLRNFSEAGELGASVSVWQNGKEIISLHHGWRDKEETIPWTDDTLVPVWSVTKGPAAITTLLALHKAGIPPESPVIDVWPELRAAREGKLTFADLLAHRAGLPALDPDKRPHILQHTEVVAALETQEPHWTPRRSHGYHPRTYGFLLEEIVRRVTHGTSLGVYWRERIADPCRIDFHIGRLTAEDLERTATIIPPKVQKPNPEELPFFQAITNPDSIAAQAFSSPSGMRALSDINKAEFLQAGLPALGGVGSANGIAKFYQVLLQGGILDGVQVIPKTICQMAGSQKTAGVDETFQIPTAFATGFMKDPLDEKGEKVRRLFGPSHRAYGQPGAGGSHAFADPEHGVSFAYVMNQMETGVLPNRKSLDLVEMLYEELL